jgi:cytochrome P450
VYPFIPDVRRVWKQNAKARDLITPIIKQRERNEKLEGYKKPNDTIEWVRDLLPNADKRDYGYQGIAQLAITAVSIHTVTQLTTNSIFNLAAYPEYQSILREEIEIVLKGSGGVWTLDGVSKLKKLDSFMKESLRHHTPTTSKCF